MTVKGAALAAAMLVSAARLPAQQWNDARVLDLVQLATNRRAQQLADTGLRDYAAKAHGYVTFLAQLGEGFREPPQIVKADELALEVYWRAPNLSKQLIVGRRDSTLLPTDIRYHRDHLGIVQNNFPATIRLGEGDEVRDVPHPLSAAGLTQYDFALSDSLRISFPGHAIEVYEVKVRPRDDREARIIGALYLERETGQVVRMAFSFTRAAFLDKQLEDVFIVLENGLVGTRFWLPLHQEVEIRRTATWLDYPVRGIIRGRWEIGDYQLNGGLPGVTFAGPEIAFSRPHLENYPWPSARILDSLPPDVRAVTADEIRRVQAEARSLVRDEALRRARASALSVAGLSDVLHFNRVEGTALGAGYTARLGAGFGALLRARYGTANRDGAGRAALEWHAPGGHTVRLYGERDFQDVGDVPERSAMVNSVAAQEFASDFTDPYRVTRAGAGMLGGSSDVPVSLDVAWERDAALATHASPARGTFTPLIPADTIDAWRATVTAERPTSLSLWGFELRVRMTAGALWRTRGVACAVAPCRAMTFRLAGEAEVERPLGAWRLVSHTIAAGVRGTAPTPAQELVYLGGTVTAPGYAYHSLAGTSAVSQRVELQFPMPFASISLGRFGRAPARLTLAPFATVVAVRAPDSSAVSTSASGAARDRLFARGSAAYPSVGVGALYFFDVLRVDVARGLRDGRWVFSVDANRTFWGVL